MEINGPSSSPYFPIGRIEANVSQTASTVEARAEDDAKDAKPQSLLEEIREKGLSKYAEELQEKKREELREKILQEMGLSEEALQKMSPEARAQIEKSINEEILKRMTAESRLERIENGTQSGMDVEIGQIFQQIDAKIDAAGVGIGPLLALQEADAAKDGDLPDKEKDAG